MDGSDRSTKPIAQAKSQEFANVNLTTPVYNIVVAALSFIAGFLRGFDGCVVDVLPDAVALVLSILFRHSP